MNSHDIFAALDDNLGRNLVPVADRADSSSAEKILDGKFTTAAAARQYIRGGKPGKASSVTLRSVKSGTRFTYRVKKSDDNQACFVGVLTGSDNELSYAYLGRISRDVFWLGRKVPKASDVSRDAPSAKAFDWAWRKLAQDELPDSLEVWHEGRCGRCGRKLTVPESVASGFGPECIQHLEG